MTHVILAKTTINESPRGSRRELSARVHVIAARFTGIDFQLTAACVLNLLPGIINMEVEDILEDSSGLFGDAKPRNDNIV